MSEADRRGPPVDANETLYRFITTRDWWVAEERRPSSAAFDGPKFSVNIASRTTVPESTRQLHDVLSIPNGGIVSFGCGQAREWGFETRDEPDEQFPNNEAHAHVYYDGGTSSRKRNARRLAMECAIVLEPTFDT